MGSVINRKPKKDNLSYTTSLPNYRRKMTPSETSSVASQAPNHIGNQFLSHMKKKSSSESSAERKRKKISFSGGNVAKNLMSENEKWNSGGNGFHNVYSPLPF